jgi:hypothetical protein
MWFGIWSGPDAYNSVLSKNPGWTPPDFPVLNMHPHAWPLYSAAKLLGLAFHESGIDFRLDLPLPEYEFSSPLLGFKKIPSGYSGWYAPAAEGVWKIELTLPEEEIARFRQISVNGVSTASRFSGKTLHFSGRSKPGKPLRWSVS